MLPTNYSPETMHSRGHLGSTPSGSDHDHDHQTASESQVGHSIPMHQLSPMGYGHPVGHPGRDFPEGVTSTSGRGGGATQMWRRLSSKTAAAAAFATPGSRRPSYVTFASEMPQDASQHSQLSQTSAATTSQGSVNPLAISSEFLLRPVIRPMMKRRDFSGRSYLQEGPEGWFWHTKNEVRGAGEERERERERDRQRRAIKEREREGYSSSM